MDAAGEWRARVADDCRAAALELLHGRMRMLAARVEVLERHVLALEAKAGGGAGGGAAEEDAPDVTVREIMSAVAEAQGVTREAIRDHGRAAPLAEARHMAAWLARRLRPDMSYPQIGKAMGGRDHTTVMNSVRAVEADERLRERALEIARGQGWIGEGSR